MKQGSFSMHARVSVPVDYTATQFLGRMILPRNRSEEIAEREDQSGFPSGRRIYPSMIGREPTVGDPIIDIENWRNRAHSSATIGAVTLALRVGRLGRTFSSTDFLSTEVSAAIANTLAPEQNLAIEVAICQIEEFRSRKDGWKGPDSLGPREPTIDGAKTFAKAVLADSKIDSPHIGLAADGEITFFWQNPKITIDLRIAGDGTYAYFAKPDTGMPFFEDAAPVTENFPEKILSLIRRAA
jgi:hypothetical protein